MFLMGNSLGGLISSFVAVDNKANYTGLCLTVPYFGLYDEDMLNKVRPMLDMMNKVSPNKTIPFGGRS